MSYEPSGEKGTDVAVKPIQGESFSKLTASQGHRLTGYDSVYGRSGSFNNVVAVTVQTKTERLSVSSAKPAHRDAIRRALSGAEKEAARMEVFAGNGDLIELSNAGFNLEDALNELWKLRNEREDDWGDLLNILQGALAHEEYERFSVDQCYTIRIIISEHLANGSVDIDDIERSIKLLRKAGFDPWKGISGSVDEEDKK